MIIRSAWGREARQRWAKTRQKLVLCLVLIISYLVVCFYDCPAEDLAGLSSKQRAEVVSRWNSP